MYHRYFAGLVICLFNLTGFVFADELSIHQTNLNLVERIAKLEEGQKVRFQALEEAQKAIVVEMRTRFQVVEQRFESLEKSIDKRFEAVDRRFEAVDQRFEAIDARFDIVDERFNSLIREINQRFASVDQRFEALDQRFASIDQRFEALDQRFEALDQRFESLEKRLDLIENHVGRLGTFMFTMLSAILAAIIALIAYNIWDRKTVFDKIEQLFQSHIEKYHTPEPIEMKQKGRPEQNKTIDQLIDEGYEIPKNMQDKLRDVFNFVNQFPEMRPVLNIA